MKLNIYTRDNCDYCKMLVIPEELNINIINVDVEYSGFVPGVVPVLQYEGVNLEGAPVINSILQLAKDVHNGDYTK
tara:strand:+ start:478 stop:705 length:228 start_codon:yes stop_codon:yes gene_type:complete